MTQAGALLTLAAESLGKTSGVMVGRWPRTVSVLGRQAIEASLVDYWRLVEPSMERVSNRAQLLSLRVYLEDEYLAEQVSASWAQLCRACHYRSYDLPPTESELRAWLGIAKRFDDHITELRTHGVVLQPASQLAWMSDAERTRRCG